MRNEDIDILKSLTIFRNVKERTFERAIAPSFFQSFPAGTQLLEENKPADFLYIVFDGLVEMSSSLNDDRTVIEILAPVHLFILAAVLNNDVCLQSARTLMPSRILMIPANLIRELLRDDHHFMEAVVFELASAYRRTVKELKNQKLRSGAERLANWLLREHIGQGSGGMVNIPFEKRVLASYLGMTPENLSRGFSTIAKYGVTANGSYVQLSDLNALEQFAKPSPLIDGSEPQR